VALIDQLTAVLGNLSLCERVANRPTSAADAAGGVEHLTDVAGSPQAIGAREAGEAGAHDDDPGRSGGPRRGREASEGREGHPPGTRSTQKRTPRRAPFIGGDGGHGCLQRLREWRSHSFPFVSFGLFDHDGSRDRFQPVPRLPPASTSVENLPGYPRSASTSSSTPRALVRQPKRRLAAAPSP